MEGEDPKCALLRRALEECEKMVETLAEKLRFQRADASENVEKAQASEERARVVGLLNFHKERTIQLNDALERAKVGQFGVCEGCGRQIEPERLTILPETTICAQCAQEVGG